jgi:predicted AlkP superfamily phosphohydrolase/phosphomutase
VFADVLSAIARVGGPALSEATRTRVDRELTGALIYVTMHAVPGAAAGAALAGTPLAARPTLRAVLLGALIGLADLVALGAIWRHRALPLLPGLLIVAGAALAAAAAAAGTGRAAGRLPARIRVLAAGVLSFGVPVLTVALLLGAARGPARPPGPLVTDVARSDTGTRVAIVAIDGLDGRLVDEALAQGRLPNLRALIERGVRGDLRSIRPPKSPVVWTSAVTGVLPRQHGILDFVVRREGQRVPVTSNLRRVPALWNLGEVYGFTSAFVNWYVTWPAEAVAGAIVSDRADFDGLDRRVFPAELTLPVDSARAAIDARPERDPSRFTSLRAGFGGYRASSWGQVRRALGILDDVVRHDLVTLAAIEVLLARGQPDLVAAYFRGTDNTQHLFWKHRLAAARGPLADVLYGPIESAELEALAPVIDRYYDFADELLGRLIGHLAPGTAVLVVSDHGFLTNNERGRWYNADRLLAATGLAVLEPDGGGPADSTRSEVRDEQPPSIVARRVLRAGGAAKDAAASLARARDVLVALRTDRGEEIFRSVALGEDERGPWLAVVFRPRPAGRSVAGLREELALDGFLQPEGHSGDHRMNGLLIAAGPPFRKGRIYGARAVDLAPTVMHVLGAPVARDVEGVVLADLLDPGWSARYPVRYVATWGTRADADSGVIATQADERIREELRALGYLK